MSNQILPLHDEAMALADQAFAAKRAGNSIAAQQYFHRAFELEAQAADSIAQDLEAEPTRSVLFRSAATLALHCGLLEEAIKLVQRGLAGNPPATIAEELRTVVDDASRQRPLNTSIFARKIGAFLSDKQWVINHNITLPPREPRYYEPTSLALSSQSQRYIRSRFSRGLYGHQLAALQRFADRQNICLATGTSSGKSMVFYTAAIEHLIKNPKSKVLILYPLKALGREQEGRIKEAFAAAGVDFVVGRLDGQVPTHSRVGIVKKSNVLIATPDIIHAWFLSSISEPALSGFLAQLGLIIVDEVHNYSGVFGSNAAFLYRRLECLAELLGGKCRYIAASATIANPNLHLRKLFGIEFQLVGPEEDTSPRNNVEVVLATPPSASDLLSNITELLRFIAAQDEQRFIAFVDSRKQVEYLTAIIRRGDGDREAEAFRQDHLDAMHVLPFRAGYELEDRNKIQDRLSTGSMRGVVSTSALELGIDIPHLDTGVLVGVPPSLTSLLQRIGRIGRHKPGTVLVINRGDLQDQQAFRHADTFMSRPLTESSLYLENKRIQYLHALCLARHGGEQDAVNARRPSGDAELSSDVDWPAGFLELCRKERIGEIPTELQGMKMEAGENPNYVFPLRDVESEFQVELKQGPEQRALGRLSHSQVLREAYPGAVYYYTGQPFRVYRIFQHAKRIEARPEAAYTTKPTFLPTLVFPNLSPGNVHNAGRLGQLTVVDCNLQIREVIVGYKERRGPNEITVQYPLSFSDTGLRFDLPRFTRNYFTTGVVFTHPALSRPGVHGEVCAELIYEAFLSLIPFERQDVGAACDRHRADRDFVRRDEVFVAIHDQTYGSLHLTSRLLEENLLGKVLERTAELIDTSGIRESEPVTARALEEVAHEAGETLQPISITGSVSVAPPPAGQIRVIMPGSRGLNVQRDNEEFDVQRVFFSPTLQSVAYRGRHHGTTIEEVVEIVHVDALVPIPGESRMGMYDLDTGDLAELSTPFGT